jgi:hypothetical protein
MITISGHFNLHRIAADPKYAALGERLKEKYGKR